MTETITLAEAERLARQALERAGTAASAAASVANALVRAEADGLSSHGLARIPAYCAQVRSGKVRGRAVPRLVPLGPSGARVDAGYGFAFPALDLAIDTAVERAEKPAPPLWPSRTRITSGSPATMSSASPSAA